MAALLLASCTTIGGPDTTPADDPAPAPARSKRYSLRRVSKRLRCPRRICTRSWNVALDSAGKLLETDQGEFKDGRLKGFAVLTFTSGRKFEGNFVDQKPQGQGTLSEANGEVYSGQWSQGCFNDRGRQATFNTSKQACGFN
jgi:hypothetical protein